jgi:hypothetical protein
MRLGALTVDQQRLTEAETNYRKALEISREIDPQTASISGTRLGAVLAQLGRHW